MGWNRRLLTETYEYTPAYPPDCGENCSMGAPSPDNTFFKNLTFPYPLQFFPKYPTPNSPSICFTFSKTNSNHRKLIILAISVVLAACLFILVYYTLLIRCSSLLQLRRRRRRRTRTIPLNSTPGGNGVEEEEDEDLMEEDIHHVWYIRTVGLDQNTIDSITICPYRKADGLIDGTDCSICLSEFDEGEIVRLLPKCSHAFHVSCIDTWLRAHVNCPLCRAPIVSPPVTTLTTTNSTHTNPTVVGQLDSSFVNVSLRESGSGANSSENPQILQLNSENSITGIQITTRRIQELLLPSSSTSNVSTKATTSSSILESGFRVQSDLGRFGGQRVTRRPSIDGSSATIDLQQPTRRSISMDFSAMAVADGGLYGEDGSYRQDRKKSIMGSRLPPISSGRAIMERQWCGPKRVSTLVIGRSAPINGGNNKFFVARFGRGIRRSSNSEYRGLVLLVMMKMKIRVVLGKFLGFSAHRVHKSIKNYQSKKM